MAITILTPPRSPALSLDDNYIVVQTNIPTATARPGFLISGTSADGDVLNLRWGNTLVQTTFATAPDNTGLQLRAAAGQTESDYLAQLVEGMYAIPAIEAAFLIEQRDDGVRLTLRGALTGALLATSSGVSVAIFGSAEAAQYPGLSAFISVYQEGIVAPIGRFAADYDRDGVTDFNLASLFEIEVGLPPVSDLGGLAGYTVSQPTGYAEYYLRYADRYGRPPQPETLTKSPTYSVVAGGSRGLSRLRWGSGGNVQLCHAYFTEADQYFVKPISYGQPDWAYVYLNVSASVGASVTVYFSDGTMETRQVVASASRDKGLHAFPSGPYQCGLDQVPGWEEKTAIRYTFALTNGPSIVYELEPPSPEWETVLAYDNGAGGIETVGFRGKSEFGYAAQKQTFRRARTRVRGSDKGEVVTYNTEGRSQDRLRSGYYSKEYIAHLRQLLVGRVWKVDRVTGRFIAVNVASSSLRLVTDDAQLHAIELTISDANRDKNAHNL
jgi:hypothetical protein